MATYLSLSCFALLLLSCWLLPRADAAPFVLGNYYIRQGMTGYFKFDLEYNTMVREVTLPLGGGVASQATGLLYAFKSYYFNSKYIVTVDMDEGQIIHESPLVDLGLAAVLGFDDGWNALILGNWAQYDSELSFWTIDPKTATKQLICNVTLPVIGLTPYFFYYTAATRVVTLAYTKDQSGGSFENIFLVDLNKKALVGVYPLTTGPGALPAWADAAYASIPGLGPAVLGVNFSVSSFSGTTAQLTAYNLASKSFNLLGSPVPASFFFYNGLCDVSSNQTTFALWVQEKGRQGPSIARWSLPDGSLVVTPIEPWTPGYFIWSLLTLVDQ